MKINLFIIVLCFFIISCSSVPNKDHQQQKIVEEKTTFLESSKTKGILESLASDLRKPASQIMNENEEAQIINKDMIIYGKGGVLGSGQFYGYNWSLRNGIVTQVSYIAEYNENLYRAEQELSIQKYGKGIDLNGNGRVWNTYEDGGAGLMLVNGKPSAIIFSASTDFISLY